MAVLDCSAGCPAWLSMKGQYGHRVCNVSPAHPGIRYAGRLDGDPPGDLGQGEATMFTGTGSH